MDRFYRGFFSGVIAGIPLNLWNLFSFYVLNFPDLRFLDWAGVLLFGSFPETFVQQVIAQVIQLIWAGFLGIIFVYLIPQTTSRGYIGKAVIYSVVAAFFMYAIPILLQFPHLAQITTNTVVDNMIGGLIWGLILGYMAKRLDYQPQDE